jgi:N-methylhydantoinase B
VELGKIDMIDVANTDTVTVLTPGGGGYGDPLDRDPALVLADVQRGFVSLEGAERDYGVVLGNEAVDTEATEQLRDKRRGVTSSENGRSLFDFGRERTVWESVFDDALMARISNALYARPPTARGLLRQRIFQPVLTFIARDKPFDADALRAARSEVEAILADIERSLAA